MDILTIYQFCSFGGVERMLLNRAMAFKNSGIDVVFHAAYLQDSGALESFKRYIQLHDLDKNIIPVLLKNNDVFKNKQYDLISVIDTPEIFQEIRSLRNVVVECHTPYIQNRKYLKDLPRNIKKIIVPSNSFRSLLINEFPHLPEVIVWPNPVSTDFFENYQMKNCFQKRPIIFLSRMDSLKNYSETMDIFEAISDREDIFFIMIGAGITLQEKTKLLEQKKLLGRTLLRESISFADIPKLTAMVRQNKGIFISSSKGESFGLSAAEFICKGVPVLLSGIPAHSDLVEQDESFLYELGNIQSAKRKLNYLLDNWDLMNKTITLYRDKFRYSSFIDNWTLFLRTYDNH